MDNIIKAAAEAVKSAKSMIPYYEKEIASKQESLERAKQNAEQLEKEFNEMIEKLKTI